MDEVESALTEEETHHPNIQIMARILWELSIAQQNIAAAIKLLGDDITNTPS
jgi:hypothetical protein